MVESSTTLPPAGTAAAAAAAATATATATATTPSATTAANNTPAPAPAATSASPAATIPTAAQPAPMLLPNGKKGRLPPQGLHPDLHGVVTDADVRAKIASATAAMAHAAPSTHYARTTTATSARAAAGTVPAAGFSILQFNLLAEGLSSGPPAAPPFEATKAGSFGGFTAVPKPDVCLDFNLRKWRLVEEILRHNADVVAVQECDHFHDFFEPVLAIFGYKGLFCAKDDSPCLGFGYYSDGVGLFYKAELWELSADFASGYYLGDDGKTERGQGYIIAPLTHRASSTTVLVATTHLKAKISNANESLRASMITQLLAKIATMKAYRPSSTAVVLAADFNADSYDSVDTKTKEVVPAKAVPAVLACANPRLASAYPIPASEAEMYTTWKKRGDYEAKHCIDYIWHSADTLVCSETLDMVADNAMHEARLPGFQFPSDHLSLFAKFNFTNLPPAKIAEIGLGQQVHNVVPSGMVEATEAGFLAEVAASAAAGGDHGAAKAPNAGAAAPSAGEASHGEHAAPPHGTMYLLDLSGSMYGQLHIAKRIVKARIRTLAVAGKLFNVAGFSDSVDVWKPSGCIPTTAADVEAACDWVAKLGVQTSTNTLKALNEAHNDPLVAEVVLLSDGLPDCHPRHIFAALGQAGRRPVVVNTIAFNCSEQAKTFLADLAESTGGKHEIADVSAAEVAEVPESPHAAVSAAPMSPTPVVALPPPPASLADVKTTASAFVSEPAVQVAVTDADVIARELKTNASNDAALAAAAIPPPKYPSGDVGGDNTVNINVTARLDGTQPWNNVHVGAEGVEEDPATDGGDENDYEQPNEHGDVAAGAGAGDDDDDGRASDLDLGEWDYQNELASEPNIQDMSEDSILLRLEQSRKDLFSTKDGNRSKKHHQSHGHGSRGDYSSSPSSTHSRDYSSRPKSAHHERPSSARGNHRKTNRLHRSERRSGGGGGGGGSGSGRRNHADEEAIFRELERADMRDGEKARLEFVKLSDECRFHELAKPKPNHARDKAAAKRAAEEQALLLQRQQKLLAQQNRTRKLWERELTAYQNEERALYTSQAGVKGRINHQKASDRKAAKREQLAFEAKCEKDRLRLQTDAARVQHDWEETVAGDTLRASVVRSRLDKKRNQDEQYEADLVHMDAMRRTGNQAKIDKVENARDLEATLEAERFATRRKAELRRRELADHRQDRHLDQEEQERIRIRASKNAAEAAHKEEEDAAELARERLEDKSVQRVKRRLAKDKQQKEQIEATRHSRLEAHNSKTASRGKSLEQIRSQARAKEDAVMAARRTKRRNLEDSARKKEDAAYNKTVQRLNATKRPMEESPIC